VVRYQLAEEVPMTSCTLDERGVVTPCSRCGQKNRTIYDRLGDATVCGKCKNEIPPPSAPVDVPTVEAFDAAIHHSAIPVVVDYWAAWCGPCRMVAPELEKIAAQHAGDYLVVKVDTEALHELSVRYHIQSIPMLAVFYRGHEKARTVGARPAREILTFIHGAVAVEP
jgi:thioredoxin 2